MGRLFSATAYYTDGSCGDEHGARIVSLEAAPGRSGRAVRGTQAFNCSMPTFLTGSNFLAEPRS